MSSALLRLGQVIEKHRRELGLSQEDVSRRNGPSDVTWRGIVAGTGPKPSASTLKKIDSALEWTRGSAANVLAGGAPTINSAPGLGDPRLDGYEQQPAGLDAFSTVELLHEVEARVVALQQFMRLHRNDVPRPATVDPVTAQQLEEERQSALDHDEANYAAYLGGGRAFDEVTERRFRERMFSEEPVAARTAVSEDIEEHTRSLQRGEESQDPGGDEPS